MDPRHLTQEQLSAGLDRIAESPRDEGVVEMLIVRPEVNERLTPARVEVSAELGVHGDRWSSSPARDYPDTQISLMNSRLLDLVSGGRDRWAMVGDNMIVDMDLSEATLPPGQKLAVGSAILEITDEPHTGCKKFSGRFGAEALRFVNTGPGKELRLRGIYARVAQPGLISVGDRLYKL
jgi:MOSC domain-containing protein YiiM